MYENKTDKPESAVRGFIRTKNENKDDPDKWERT